MLVIVKIFAIIAGENPNLYEYSYSLPDKLPYRLSPRFGLFPIKIRLCRLNIGKGKLYLQREYTLGIHYIMLSTLAPSRRQAGGLTDDTGS